MYKDPTSGALVFGAGTVFWAWGLSDTHGSCRSPARPERARAIRQRLLDARTEAPVHVLEDALWLRISAAAYNERTDYERLADILAVALRE